MARDAASSSKSALVTSGSSPSKIDSEPSNIRRANVTKLAWAPVTPPPRSVCPAYVRGVQFITVTPSNFTAVER